MANENQNIIGAGQDTAHRVPKKRDYEHMCDTCKYNAHPGCKAKWLSRLDEELVPCTI